MRPTLSALAAALIVALATPAGAYSVSLGHDTSGPVVRWPTSNLTYYLHPDCSTDLPTSACLDAVRASFAEWTKFGCTSLSFQDMGLSSNKQLTSVQNGASNGKNEIAWIENSAWIYGTVTLGVTSPVYYPDSGEIIEADIAMNGYSQTWAMSGQNYTTDVMNVAVHEIGHFFGLQHVLSGYDESDPPTMATTADPFMASRTPAPDDADGVCFLYPAGSWTCASNDDCPAVVAGTGNNEYYLGIQPCTGGQCAGVSNDVPQGDAQLGDACIADYDCVDPWFCQPLSNGSGVCATGCQTAAPNCPSGFECAPYSNSPGNGVCLESQGGSSGGDGQPGDPCTSGYDCAQYLCIQESTGAFCRQPCYSADACPTGQSCNPLSGSNMGACFDDAGTTDPPPTGKALGETCGDSGECASALCAGSEADGYYCIQPCYGSSQCPTGYTCTPLTNGGGGCFPDQGPTGTGDGGVGDTCSAEPDCKSSLCVSIDGTNYFCTATCSSDATCGCGYECAYTLDNASVCGPGDPVGCLPLGAACAANTECTSGLCEAGKCAGSSGSCDVLGGAGQCGAGEACQRGAAGSTAGACAPAGASSVGKPCGADSACQTLFCLEGLCAQPCDPGSLTCPAGQACAAATGSLGACVDPATGGVPDGGPDEADAGTGGGADATGGGGDVTDPKWNPGTGGTGGSTSSGCAGGGQGAPVAPSLALLLAVAAWLLRRRRSKA